MNYKTIKVWKINLDLFDTQNLFSSTTPFKTTPLKTWLTQLLYARNCLEAVDLLSFLDPYLQRQIFGGVQKSH